MYAASHRQTADRTEARAPFYSLRVCDDAASIERDRANLIGSVRLPSATARKAPIAVAQRMPVDVRNDPPVSGLLVRLRTAVSGQGHGETEIR